MMGSARQAMMVLAIASFTLGGCEGEKMSPHAAVHGKVTYNGKPVTSGTVMFVPTEVPKEGALEGASGDIQPDGSYTLKSQATGGAVLGVHKVVVYSTGELQAPKEAPKEGAAPKADTAPKRRSILPNRYSELRATPLTYKVVAGDNNFDIELKD